MTTFDLQKINMRKIIFYLTLTLLISACGNKSFVAEKWENGKDKIVLRIDKGTKEKPEVFYMKAYYPNGNLFKEGLIKDSLEDGVWKSYYASGELKSKGSYSLGKKVGEYNIYYRDGKVEQNGTYEADSIVTAFLYDHYGKMMETDSTALWLDTTNTKPSWTDIQYALMHMECNMIFFDNYDRGTQACTCFLDVLQKKLTYNQYEMMTDRQISQLMIYIRPEYKDCLD
jgi:hypothetical protein